MSEKFLKFFIYSAGIVCLFAFLAVRIFPLFNAALYEKIIPEYWENTKYGELYYFNYIKHFREKDLPKATAKYRYTERHPKMKDADIIAFGDSFFDFTRMVTFPERLSQEMQKKVFYARDERPLKMLHDSAYENTEPKIFIYESAERFIPDRFTEMHDTLNEPYDPGILSKASDAVLEFMFPYQLELKYTTLLARSYPTTHIYSNMATFRFDTYKYISTMTPEYSLDEEDPWLFSWRQLKEDNPGGFYYNHPDTLIDTYCDNIAHLAAQLDKRYNLKMVFMPIPSKYTIYHTLINEDTYNNFLPRLYAGLEKRGIPVIKLYDRYKNSDEILYYGTDTHWNEKGLNVALDETIKTLNGGPQSYAMNEISKESNPKPIER